ncbi:MFS transporter [Kriegella sp. EG-1]|nr:MFS transporter [Flavobacteriaceae bacterium EG-1]
MQSLRLILSNPRYFAPAWVFTSLNILFGTWAIYIPTIKDKLAIDKSELGIAIFFLSLGVFTIFPVAAKIINKIGVGKATWYGVLLICVTGVLPLLAPNYYSLMAALFIFGATHGFTDIAMNTLVTEIEKEDKKNFMSAAHGFFSLGGVLAGLGIFLIAVIGNPVLHMVLAIAIVLVVNLLFYKNYTHITATPVAKEPFSFNLFKPLLIIGLVSFMVMGGEGAIIDWSGLYLKEVSIAPETLWGAGFLAFSITMTTGRFFGDSISQKFGSIKIVAIGSVVAIFGYLAVLSTQTYVAIFGFALIGLGFSVIIPELFRIGGNFKGIESSQGVAFIAGTGYLGFLTAPPILGFLADVSSLSLSFIVLLGCSVLVFLSTFILRKQKSN